MATRRLKSHSSSSLQKFFRLLTSRRLQVWSLAVLGFLFLYGAVTVFWWSKDLPNSQDIDTRRIAESTKIFDRTGTQLLYEIGDIRRTRVSLDQISPLLVKATLAAEDDQFYEHYGLDIFGILRGVILKPLTGQRAQGGSTITQQLIKNAILTPERTIQRKVKEAVLALELEQRFNKDEILAMYLNDIPYGSQAYGAESAAQTFFSKSVSDLKLAEAATLAALPKAPTYYSPYGSHLEDLKLRQEHILNRMASLGYVSPDDAAAAKAEDFTFSPRREAIEAPHFVFYVRELIDAEYGERVVEQGGLSIRTTLDANLQKIAEEVLRERTATLNRLGASNAALVAIDPKTGDILAMAGSVDYFNEAIDGNVNVAIRHRSPGSSIKPFVYAAAFAQGYTPDTILVDAETDFGQGYKPRNYNLQENGPVSMRSALANSLNIPAVKTLYLVGVKNATDFAQSLGLTSLTDPDRYGLSLVLGGGEVRLLDEVSAYSVFANDGVRSPHRAILEVNHGHEILFNAAENPETPKQVISSQIARLVNNVLSDNNARALTFGTNSPLQLGARPVAAKTGTTQEFRDGWTVGFTPSLAAGVWVGNNDNSPMNQKSDSGLTAAPLWNAFMKRALTGQPIETFSPPAPDNSLPHGILRGELPEVKAKLEPATNSIYTLDCPIDSGQPKTFKELHSLLFYVRRTNPRGPGPATAENDPQFKNWEDAVAAWRTKFNEKNKTNFNEPRYVASLPTPTCEIGNPEDIPKVTLVEPNTTILNSSPVTVTVSIDSPQPITQVKFLLDGQELGTATGEPYQAAFSFPPDFSGRKTLLVLATTDTGLIGRAHRTFIINPDDHPPAVELHTPQHGSVFSATSFPQTVKVTATDASGIDLVDVLYTKDGVEGTTRLGRTSTKAATAPNRYEIVWPDSPGPGTYHLYAIAYDQTGNFTQTEEHTLTIVE
jgi:1A family penicillin-binding protein